MRRALIAVFSTLVGLSLSIEAQAQGSDPLAQLDGIWVSVNPPGPHIYFNRVGLGTREASLSMGQASLRVSDGEAGSNLKVSGEGFTCLYFVGFISSREMTWELKKGDSICISSAHYKKDPP
jgi:hypothetical protein